MGTPSLSLSLARVAGTGTGSGETGDVTQDNEGTPREERTSLRACGDCGLARADLPFLSSPPLHSSLVLAFSLTFETPILVSTPSVCDSRSLARSVGRSVGRSLTPSCFAIHAVPATPYHIMHKWNGYSFIRYSIPCPTCITTWAHPPSRSCDAYRV